MRYSLIIFILFIICLSPVFSRIEDRSQELYDSANSNNLTLIKEILESPFYNTNVPMGDEELTPLMAACSKGYTEVAKILLEHEANPNSISKSGDTALILASYENHMGCVRLLLEKKAKIHLRNKRGDTALHKAVLRGNFDIAKLLLEKGIDINVKNNEGISPLMNSASSNIDFIKYIVKKGADIAAADNSNKGVLEYIKGPNAKEIRKYLIREAQEKKVKMPISWMELIFRDNESSEIFASSYLPDKKNPRMYAPTNLFDGDVATVWAVENGGIGESLWFPIEDKTKSITLVNGCAKSKELFRANNRVKKAMVSVWFVIFLEGDVTEIAAVKRATALTQSHIIDLKDSIDPQEITLPFKWEEIQKKITEAKNNFLSRPAFKERKILSEELYIYFEIADIYNGSKYNDTCISEIILPDAPVSEKKITGNWKAIKGADREEISFSFEEGEKKFVSYIHQRPFETGSWEIKNGKLYIYYDGNGDNKKDEYFTSLNRRTLTLTKTGGIIEVYERN